MAQLELKIDSLDAVPAELQGFYTADKEGFKLNLPQDGGLKEARDKIDEFRTNNVRLLKESKDNLEETEKLRTELELLKKEDPGKEKEPDENYEAMFQDRTKKMSEDFNTQTKMQTEALVKVKDELNITQTALHNSELRSQLTVALDGTGHLKKGARPFINDLANKVWKLETDKWVPRDSETGNILYGSDGNSGMTMPEWLLHVRKHNNFLWDESQGGGATGNTNKNFSNADIAGMSANEKLQRYHASKK